MLRTRVDMSYLPSIPLCPNQYGVADLLPRPLSARTVRTAVPAILDDDLDRHVRMHGAGDVERAGFVPLARRVAVIDLGERALVHGQAVDLAERAVPARTEDVQETRVVGECQRVAAVQRDRVDREDLVVHADDP